jgi:hypothetical protein
VSGEWINTTPIKMKWAKPARHVNHSIPVVIALKLSMWETPVAALVSFEDHDPARPGTMRNKIEKVPWTDLT